MNSSKGECLAWAARDTSGHLSPYKFTRRSVGIDDVSIDILYCGICYADVAWSRSKLGNTKYPFVPGHEIVGIVTQIGSNVNRFKVGDHVGVGTYVNSCRNCVDCENDLQVHCIKRIFTFDDIDEDGSVTKGGFSSYIVVHQSYCFMIPDGYPPELAAPLLCAGITVFTPMIRHNMNQPGKSLGVIGLGGLGHLAVKFGKAFGLKVVVFSTSISKKEDALDLLGADEFVISTDENEMKAYERSLDFIINTASADISVDSYLQLLKTLGVFVLVGFPPEIKFTPIAIASGSRVVAGSATGGLKRTQEMLDFCASNKIYPEIEKVPIQYTNEALERMIIKDIKYRFVIDVANSLK